MNNLKEELHDRMQFLKNSHDNIDFIGFTYGCSPIDKNQHEMALQICLKDKTQKKFMCENHGDNIFRLEDIINTIKQAEEYLNTNRTLKS